MPYAHEFCEHGFSWSDSKRVCGCVAYVACADAARVRDLEAQLAAAKGERDKATAKADAHERDWYAAKAEFGDAMAAQRERLRASESAHAETRRELDEARTLLAMNARLGVEFKAKRDASVAREAETWRMVEALIEGIANAPGRLPSYIQEPRDALLAARAEREAATPPCKP